MSKSFIAITLAVLLGTAPQGVAGQVRSTDAAYLSSVPVTVSVRTGTSRLTGGGDVFDLFRRDLGLSESSFDSGILELEISGAVSPHIDVLLGGAIRGSREAVTRGWDDVEGFEQTEQFTRLSVTPGLHVGARMFAFPRTEPRFAPTERTANPYGLVGIGRGSYALRQWGQFVDRTTEEVFGATFASKDSYYRAFVGIGIDFAVTESFGFTMEARREFGSPTPEGDFHRFEDLSLSGLTVSLGLSLRRP